MIVRAFQASYQPAWFVIVAGVSSQFTASLVGDSAGFSSQLSATLVRDSCGRFKPVHSKLGS
jgi:hypothetical protein